MKKNKKIIITSIIAIVLLLGIIISTYDNIEHTVLMDEEKQIRATSSISMMLETGVSTGIYEASTDTAWPSSSYTFNASLSSCENGSTLSWDSTNNTVIVTGNVSDKCYIYFDVKEITGSAYFYILDSDNNEYAGGEFSLYYLAQISDLDIDDVNSLSYITFVYTDEFSEYCSTCTGTYDDIESTELPSIFENIVREYEINANYICSNSDGYIKFDDLKIGLYLVVQTGESSYFETVSPFIFMLPMDVADDVGFIYDIDVTPMIGVVTPTEPEEEEPEEYTE